MPDWRGINPEVEENARLNGVIVVGLKRFHPAMPRCLAINALSTHVLLEGHPTWVKAQLEKMKIPVVLLTPEPAPIFP
jgi:hypothetical protein